MMDGLMTMAGRRAGEGSRFLYGSPEYEESPKGHGTSPEIIILG